MDKRILALLIAAMAGTAYAQSNSGGYVTSSSGNAVRSTSNSPVQSSTSAPVQPSASAAAQSRSSTVAQSSASDRSTRRAAAPAAANANAPVVPGGRQPEGYVISSERSAIVDSSGHCVRTSTWSPANAAEPCDVVPRASTPPVPVAAAPQPEPQPAPIAKAAPETPPPPVLEKITLSTDVLFEFNKAELREGGKEKLDELAQKSKGAEVDRIVLAGYADRIGSEQYNKELSEKRAQAVADYLASKGIDQSRLQVEGRGEDQPVTGDQCKRMGAEKASNKKLVQCLQPDRRVEAELLGSREVARGTTTSPATGATGTGASTSTGGSSQ
jgi:OOP family OmpA-OmpF porin